MSNPYITPERHEQQKSSSQNPSAIVMAPAIALIVLAVIGLLAAIFSAIVPLIVEPAPINPNDPPFLQQIQANQLGPAATAAIGVAFAVLNAVILLGAVQMLRFKMWGFALTVSILSMINIGNCCCLIGLPVGIWSIVVLSQPRVKQAFK